MRAMHYPTGAHRLAALAIGGLLVAALALMVLVNPAQAGKPSSATVSVSDSSFAAVEMAYVSSGGKVEVSLTESAAVAPSSQRVKAECFQDGVLVYRQYASVSNGAAALTLGPTPMWQGGSAECTAEVGEFDKRQRFRVSDMDTFSVAG